MGSSPASWCCSCGSTSRCGSFLMGAVVAAEVARARRRDARALRLRARSSPGDGRRLRSMPTPSGPKRFPPPFYAFAATVVRWSRHPPLRPAGHRRASTSPARAACVVASNHVSAWDPPVVGCTTPREIHFMAKKELFERWLRSPRLPGTARLPGRPRRQRRRRGQGGAAAAAERPRDRRLLRGDPQRERRRAPQEGAAFLAQRAGVPLVPAAIWREGRRFRVAFGPAMPPPGKGREEAAGRRRSSCAPCVR